MGEIIIVMGEMDRIISVLIYLKLVQESSRSNYCNICRMFKIKRYKLLSRKYGIIEKNCSDKTCRTQKDLFTDLINLGGVAKVKVISIFLMKHPNFVSRI